MRYYRHYTHTMCIAHIVYRMYKMLRFYGEYAVHIMPYWLVVFLAWTKHNIFFRFLLFFWRPFIVKQLKQIRYFIWDIQTWKPISRSINFKIRKFLVCIWNHRITLKWLFICFLRLSTKTCARCLAMFNLLTLWIGLN